MFKDEQFYEAKVFLKSYADALSCIAETAQKEEELAHYERSMYRVLDARRNDEIEFKYDTISQGKKFGDLKESKLFQFSNQIFKKYFDGLDSVKGDFKEVRKVVDDGLEKLRADAK